MTPEEIISMITERVKDTANVRVVFGDPIEAKGVTIIPVATVKVAGGGGGGKGRISGVSPEGEQQAEGGIGLGLQIAAKPLGYIEVVDGAAKLVPVVDVTKVTLTSMITGGLVLLTFGKLAFKVLKHKRMAAHWAQAHQ